MDSQANARPPLFGWRHLIQGHDHERIEDGEGLILRGNVNDLPGGCGDELGLRNRKGSPVGHTNDAARHRSRKGFMQFGESGAPARPVVTRTRGARIDVKNGLPRDGCAA